MKLLLMILAALLLLLMIPVRVKAAFDGSPELEIGWLFLKKRILPKPPKREKPAKAKKTKQKPKKEKPKRKFPLTVWDIIELIPEAAGRLLPPVRKLLRRTVIARFSLRMVVVGSDAADTAVRFGRTNAAVANAVAVLDRIMTLRAERVDIFPGFTSAEAETEASCVVRAYPLAVLIAGVQLAVSALVLLVPAIRRRKKKNRAAEAAKNNENRKDDRNGEENPARRSA